ncbi:unnamed protein product [Leptidea sinapis]|uniref:PPAF-2-like Clip domain-containing protein n=1 Tax=Leptidea sinapis TaxID=189913 RepID=A0A5E4QM58_9NEOP|nr:unnamed protein product [Leptidea sinapis]
MADGTKGKCVQFFLCDSNDKIIMDGRTVIDIRVRVAAGGTQTVLVSRSQAQNMQVIQSTKYGN